MRRVAVLLPLLLATVAAPQRAGAAAPDAQLSEDEQAFCESELEVVERRRRIFQGQGLPAAEIARRNGAQLAALAECRERLRGQQRRALEEKQDLGEAARRAGPDATEREREQAWREIRRERLASRSPSALTSEERAELAAGMQEEVAATHAALDSAHARDPAFMRVVHSALACYHGDRKDELDGQIASEQAHVKLGTGDRQKLYALRSELRQSEEVLSRSREAARRYAGGLERCSTERIAIISHCLAIQFHGRRGDPACESEEIQQYVRFVK
jgi:hypothetical protein